MTADDPFAELGLTAGASQAQVRAARRRLAFDLHPDRGGDQEAMQALNAAFEACIAHLTGRRPLVPRRRTRLQRLEFDTPSFTIDLLPVEAFEALLVVAASIGEVVDGDSPYVLECLLAAPFACWCRLELVPDAGASTVSLVVGQIDDEPEPLTAEPPSAEAVRDLWVEELNRLGQQPL